MVAVVGHCFCFPLIFPRPLPLQTDLHPNCNTTLLSRLLFFHHQYCFSTLSSVQTLCTQANKTCYHFPITQSPHILHFPFSFFFQSSVSLSLILTILCYTFPLKQVMISDRCNNKRKQKHYVS